MGNFSWMFCDKQNKEALKIGNEGYLLEPDGEAIKTSAYDGYGRFGPADEVDAYVCVADWNRKYLAEHPEFVIPQHGRYLDEETRTWHERQPKRVSDFAWWPYFSDLSMSAHDIEVAMREQTVSHSWEYRYIGIEIACYDDQNEKLPFPIKIASGKTTPYAALPPSKADPNQGFSSEYWD